MKANPVMAALLALTACTGPKPPQPGDTYTLSGEADPWCKNPRYVALGYKGQYPDSYVLLKNLSTGELTAHRAVYFMGWPKVYERDPVPCINQ